MRPISSKSLCLAHGRTAPLSRLRILGYRLLSEVPVPLILAGMRSTLTKCSVFKAVALFHVEFLALWIFLNFTFSNTYTVYAREDESGVEAVEATKSAQTIRQRQSEGGK